MMNKIKLFIKFVLFILFIVSTARVYSQSTITADQSLTPPDVILHVKGSAQHNFTIIDSSGWLAIDKSQPSALLDINGGIKLEIPNIGNPNDYFMSFQTLSGSLKSMIPQAYTTGSPHFQNIDSVTSNVPGELYTDDFIFGSDNLLYNGNTDHYSKMFFDISESAFRAGHVNSLRWDTDSLGQYSAAFGFNTKANKNASFAIGKENLAIGDRSTVMGGNNKVSGAESFAIGKNNKSAWPYNYLVGNGNIGNRSHAYVFGENNSVNGDNGIALGFGNTINHAYNLAIGSFNETGQTNATAIGSKNMVTGTSSLVTGSRNICSGSTAIVMGDRNLILAYQSVALGTELNSEGSFNGAFGHKTMAVRDYTFAAGDSVRAFGFYATALGKQTEATGFASMAMGDSTQATGRGSFAFGNQTNAKSAYEIVIGTHNTNYNPISTSNWNVNDRLFTIGRGPISLAPYDALIVKKNGKVGIDAMTYNSQLTVNGFESDGTISTLEIISEDFPDTMRMDGNEIDGVQFLAINANSKNALIIGTDALANGYALAVGGKIAVNRIRSQVKKQWPDYVFEVDYNLMTANEIENFIRENGHLPAIPSAHELEAKGLNLSEMQRLMLEKIEELTLNIIKLEKKLKNLEAHADTK